MKNAIPSELMEAMRPVCYQFTLADKIKGAWIALKLRFFPRKVLVAGPFAGEFGHELMDWQAWVRALAGRYREVHVITYPGRDFLYPGCQVHYHDIPLTSAGYRFGKFPPQELEAMARRKAAELGLQNYDLMTALAVCTRYHRNYLLPPKFELLAKRPEGGPIRDIAFHFRAVKKEGPDVLRNYPTEQCDRVVAWCRERGYRGCCVGHPLYSYCPAGVEDLRTEDLAASVAAISSARLLAGELSGPSHLAQLCGVPIVIWAPDQWRIDNCHRWNVFQVPTFVVANDTSNPPPEKVCEVLDEALTQLKSPGGSEKSSARPEWTKP
ncbi:MAG TPA: hypothetical protein VGM54_21780 [Chthoniobacter sp.]